METFKNLLTDLGFWGLIVAIIGSVAALYQIRQNRKRKSLSYEVLADSQLVSVHSDVKGRIKIFFDDEPVENMHLVLLRFNNDGDLPIEKKDFESDIEVLFGGKAVVMSVEASEARPSSLHPGPVWRENVLRVLPLLLNKGDWFTLRIWVRDYDRNETFSVNTRIVGVSNVVRRQINLRKEFATVEVAFYPPKFPFVITSIILMLGLLSIILISFLTDLNSAINRLFAP